MGSSVRLLLAVIAALLVAAAPALASDWSSGYGYGDPSTWDPGQTWDTGSSDPPPDTTSPDPDWNTTDPGWDQSGQQPDPPQPVDPPPSPQDSGGTSGWNPGGQDWDPDQGDPPETPGGWDRTPPVQAPWPGPGNGHSRGR